MKKLTRFFVLGILLLTNILVYAEFPSVSTIAEAKELKADTVYFTGELTLQYVSTSTSGFNYFAFDANDEFVRLRCFYWPELVGTDKQLYVGNNIKISGKLAFLNDDNSCVTFDIIPETMQTIEVTGVGYRKTPTIVTIEDLKADANREYNANFVSIEDAKVESVIDFNISPFPITKIVAGESSIAFTMEGVMFDFPAKANIIGYVDYENGEPKLYIPQFEGFVEPVAFGNISGSKHFKGQLGYDDVKFTANVLVTHAVANDTAYIYRVQKNDASGNPSAMQMTIPKALGLVYQAGDSVAFSVKGHYISAIYEECAGAIDKMSSSLFSVESNISTKRISQNNSISLSSYTSLIVADTEEYWTKYDNCLVTTLKGKVITSDELSAAGCIALRLKNVVAGKFDTVLVANTYYAEAGSPTEAIVCGFVGGYQYGEESYTALVPRSKYDFLQEEMEFANIAAMKAAGTTPSRDISYKLNSPMAITGFASITDNGYTTYMIFVQDATGYLQFNHNSKKVQNELKIGDVITGATGFYVGFGGSSYYTEDFGYVFATAPTLEVDASSIVASDKQYIAKPVEITLAELNDSYASQLVTIKNVTYQKEVVILSTEDKELPIIRQGKAWTILSDDYEYAAEMGSVTGVYFLYSKMTEIIPRSQEDIVVEGYQKPVDVENIVVDNNLFVQNNIVYAEGATIEVYDVMGRMIAEGIDVVDVANVGSSVIIVKTTYFGNTQFITKLVNR